MTGIKLKRNQKEFDKYFEEQAKIMHGHLDRFMIRMMNKFVELVGRENKK